MAQHGISPKYRSLTRLLDCLSVPLTGGQMRIAAQWRDDEQGLGLELPEEPRLCAFVHTYGQAAGRYGVELGFPEAALASLAGVPLVQEDLDLAHVIALLGTHFDLRVTA
ncbi:hypothetical protein G3580_19530 [Nitrogeniibacter mangrovi]|uniref:Uncharacterized protein n=1 Tax=Nitrogeniibacter mangrovi TaxID=2016596 RepID=A0A6C1BBG2_9RHOO|nr:hypothetical protein [Nitrogeniibacter mangrovi]QID19614.1 hypothetical protein G3580_19530 [Nitrogeniibacter mangrovi]